MLSFYQTTFCMFFRGHIFSLQTAHTSNRFLTVVAILRNHGGRFGNHHYDHYFIVRNSSHNRLLSDAKTSPYLNTLVHLVASLSSADHATFAGPTSSKGSDQTKHKNMCRLILYRYSTNIINTLDNPET